MLRASCDFTNARSAASHTPGSGSVNKGEIWATRSGSCSALNANAALRRKRLDRSFKHGRSARITCGSLVCASAPMTSRRTVGLRSRNARRKGPIAAYKCQNCSCQIAARRVWRLVASRSRTRTEKAGAVGMLSPALSFPSDHSE